jgi:hypothetical protein
MQLFRMKEDPALNAQVYPDKYTYNQIREAGQFMTLAVWKEGGEIPCEPSVRYENHPITKWVQQSLANWLDAYGLIEACHEEWKHRYDHPAEKVHGSMEQLRTTHSEAIRVLPRDGYTLQPCVFSDEYMVHDTPQSLSDVCDNYWNYVKNDKLPQDWFVYDKCRPNPFESTV